MTDNPWLIAVINMTIVFGVLIVLGILMKVIYWVDPTKNKKPQAKKPVPAKPASAAAAARQEEEKVAAIAAVLALVQDEDDAMAAALAAAIAEHKKKMEPMALPHHFF
jgi:sodium pump decarboxylase gamma subunit